MLKNALIIAFSFLFLELTNPDVEVEVTITKGKEKVIREVIDLNANINKLKSEKLYFKDLEEIHLLVYPIIYNSILYRGEDKRDVALVIEAISMFESASVKKHGSMPFKSTLFVRSNNAFGIKGKGHKTKTVEYYDGVRTVINSSFKSYSSFTHNINDVENILKRYGLFTERDKERVFDNMEGRYFTAPHSYTLALKRTYRSLKKLKDEQYNN